MGCIFSRPYHSSPSPELTSVHDKLQDGQVEMGDSSDKQTTATTAESTVARVVNIGASSATKATASHSLATASEPSEQGKAAASAQPQEGSEAEEQRQKRALPVVSGDEVDFVFSAIKKLLGSPQSAVDVQTLKVPTRNEAEVKLAQWSELGKVVVDWTTPLVAMLPFGPPMAAVIGGIYNRAAQAAINSANCAQLLELVQQCDRQLAKLYRGAQEQQGGLKVPDDARQGMRTMAELLVEAGHVMASYSRHGFLMRAIMSNIHKADFESLDADIRAAMQETCFAMTVELVITQGTYTDEMAAFRAAVCKAAGLPESKAEQAVKKLQQSEPELLLKLLQQHGSLADQVIVSELEALSAELKGLKLDMADVKSQLAQLQDSQDKAAARGPVALPKYLQTWWKDTVGRLIGRVANSVFLTHLVNWFKKEGLEKSLAEYDETLREEGVLPLPLGQEHVYLHCVVMPLMDKDEDGYVTRSELNYLHQLGIEYAKTVAHGLPEGLPDLLDALFLGFDRKVATKKLESAGVLALMCSKLQVAEVMRSYRIAQLLDEYHPGSRQWMYDQVNDWLNASSSSSPGGQGAASRLFLLLADAGMGKSVFSAVMHTKLVVRGNKDSSLVMAHHFFTVGHTRSQGRTMLLCLALQLAEKLPGLAALLVPVVEKHGNATKLSMQDTFTSFLLEPLLKLDKGLHPEAPRPFVLLLLDALDEADDGGRGWQPVTALIAKEFLRLPVWVRVLLTARPQVEPAFEAWNPKWIKPEALQNQRDMLALLKWRLGQGRLVADCDLEAAAQLMLEKSSGQFIYTKFAFDNLADQATWTLQELEARLPSALEGMYHRVLGTLQKALEAERPDLLELLRTRLLPVLVACLEPLTVQELAWATGCEADTSKVQQLVGLLANLFPCRPAGSDQQERVAPYHKSVLDWLTSAEGMSAGQFHVSTQEGHRLLAAACLQQAKHCVVMCEPDSTSSYTGTGLGYSLRHAVAHACLSGDAYVLQTLILEFGFWQATYTAGYGPDVLRDLMGLSQQAPAACQPTVQDVAHWLRMCSNTLVKYPWAALQLARGAPHNSFVAKRAASLPNQPAASLLTKEDDWTACLAVLNGHELDVNAVATDGKVIASGSGDKTVRVWDVATGKCMHTLQAVKTGAVKAVALSLDGKIIVSCSSYIIWVWDATTGSCINTLDVDSGSVYDVALSPDGKTMFTGSEDKTIEVWDLATGHYSYSLEGHTGRVTCLTVSADGKILAAGSGYEDTTIRVWDMDTRKCMGVLVGHTRDVCRVAFSPDATVLVSGSEDKTIKVWDVASGKCMHTWSEHTGGVTSVAFSPCGKIVVSGSADTTIRVWDVATGSCTHTLEGHIGQVTSVAFSSDGQTLMSGSWDKTIRLWDMAFGGCTPTQEGHTDKVMCTSLSTDGTILVSGSMDKTIMVWDLATGECAHTLKGHNSKVTSVALSHDNKILVSGSGDKTIKVWNLDTGDCTHTLDEHTQAVNCVALSLDAKFLVSGSQDETIKWWNTATDKSSRTLEWQRHGVTCMTLSLDGKTLVSGSGGNIKVWDLATGECKHTLYVTEEKVIHDMLSCGSLYGGLGIAALGSVLPGCGSSALGTDIGLEVLRMIERSGGMACSEIRGSLYGGLGIAALGSVPREYLSLALNTSQLVQELLAWLARTGGIACRVKNRGRYNSPWLLEAAIGVSSLALSPDGRTLVSGLDDKTIRVWDLDQGTCKSTLKAAAVGKVALSSDGRVFSSSTANAIRMWPLEDVAQACNATPPVAVAQSTDGELVEVLRSDDQQVLGALVLTQKAILSTLSITNDRIAVFAADGRLLVYQLSISV